MYLYFLNFASLRLLPYLYCYLPLREEERELLPLLKPPPLLKLLLRLDDTLPLDEELDEELLLELLLLELLLRLTLEELLLLDEELRVALELLLDEERLPLLTLELLLGEEEVLLPPLIVAEVPREEREEELLTPLVPLPLNELGLLAMVEPLSVPESSSFEMGLLTLPPSVRVVVPDGVPTPLRISATEPLTGRAVEPPTFAEPRFAVLFVPPAICVPPLDSSRPPSRSL